MTPEIEKRIKAVRAGRVPAGYKKSKVGIVPKDWDVYDLKSISIELHESAGKEIYEPLSISAGIGFVNQTNKFGKDISGAQYAKYTVLKKGDFSYNKGNSKKYPQGCVYQLKDRDVAVVPNVFESFRLINGENDFFEQLFINGFLNGQLFSKINHGVRDDGLLNLRGDDFYSCQVPFPSLSEQKKIAEILATQDRVIELKEKLIAEKQSQKKYLMNELFTGKKRIKGKTKRYVKTPLGDLPSDWSSISFSAIFDVKNEHTEDLKKYPLYSLTIENGVTPKTERYERSHLVLKENVYKVLYPNYFAYNPMNIRFGAIGLHKGNYPVSVSGYYDTFTCKDPSLLVFMENFLKSKMMLNYYDKVSTGSLIEKKRVHLSQFLEFNLPLPAHEEMRAIAEVLSTADKEISLLQKDLEQEKLKKKSLMQLLLTGLVRVNE